ncbi:chymotrypsin family serine protease [Corallococcus exiguus]|uniref:Trypsin-like peptidase domain-containing protein n=1 Tax=Corallococcus exiguus TaxID=83462 RepID=A0A7X5BS29_9BACT|nr:hypothetical protein [Corallococcus exiguus]NBC41685.1 hypothetical protein [Corallococcus exiguus]TNV67475.1 hypothetical protein FH620_00960 [Corallococcus exiguus]
MPTTLNRKPAPPEETHIQVTPGLSISGATIADKGTLGAFVQIGGVNCLLTNHHVAFSDEAEQQKELQQRMPMRATLYERPLPAWWTKATTNKLLPIFHPKYGGGGNRLARVIAYATPMLANKALDVAICPLEDNVNFSFYARGNPPYLIGPAVAPRLGMIVKKSGAVTGVTYGRVHHLDDRMLIIQAIQSPVTNDKGVQFVIMPFAGGAVADHGDSGSVWVDAETNEAVGLLYAGKYDLETRDNYSLATRMDVLEREFKFTFTRN